MDDQCSVLLFPCLIDVETCCWKYREDRLFSEGIWGTVMYRSNCESCSIKYTLIYLSGVDSQDKIRTLNVLMGEFNSLS